MVLLGYVAQMSVVVHEPLMIYNTTGFFFLYNRFQNSDEVKEVKTFLWEMAVNPASILSLNSIHVCL